MFVCKNPANFASIILVLFKISKFCLGEVQHTPPKIWLSGCIKYENDNYDYFTYSQNLVSTSNYEDSCASKASNIHNCLNSTNTLVFTCEASYPIVWKFQISQRIETEYRTISNFSADSKKPVATIYRGTATFRCQSSGPSSDLLECASTELKPEQSSYVLMTRKSSAISLPSIPSEIFLRAEANNKIYKPIILPCRTTVANETLLLEKQVMVDSNKPNELAWKSTNFTAEEITFDPLVGYILNTTNQQVEKLVGLYRCTSKSLTLQYNLTFEAFNKADFKSVKPSSGKASLTQKVDYFNPGNPETQLKCCSGVDKKPPVLKAFSCFSQLHVNYRKWQISQGKDKRVQPHGTNYDNSTDCDLTNMYTPMYLVDCKGENFELKETYVTVFHKLSIAPVKQRRKKILEADGLTTIKDTHVAPLVRYVPESTADALEPQQKIFLSFFKRINNQKSVGATESLSFQLGFDEMFIKNQTNPTDQPFSSKKDKEAHFHLKEHTEDKFDSGESLNVLCLGWQLFYVGGATLAINWKNGSTTTIEQKSFIDRQGSQLVYLDGAIFSFNKQGLVFQSVLSKEIMAKEDMKSVECWMPRRGSSQWDKVDRPLQVSKK